MRATILESIKKYALEFKIEWQIVAAFVQVESGGIGFAKDTGKIIIQFEPVWFKRKAPFAPSGKWSVNKIDVQSKEWIAFNDAFSKNKNAALESTSIGIGQIMGFHYKRLGYSTVGAMWDDAKSSEDKQIRQIFKFITTDSRLLTALKNKNWHQVATYYNGAGYRELARRYGREPYNISLQKAYSKWSN